MTTIIPPTELGSFSETAKFIVETPDEQIRTAVFDHTTGEVLAARRLSAANGRAEFDIAPILRRRMVLQPAGGATGLLACTDAMFTVRITAEGAAESKTATLVAPPHDGRLRTVTSMPFRRTIRRGESDLLTIFSPGGFAVDVQSQSPAGVENKRYEWTGSPGVAAMRLRTTDFDPGTERLTIRVDGIPAAEYDVLPAEPDTVRLAWRTAAGSVEHYTFRTVGRSVETVRTTFDNGRGTRTASAAERESAELASGYEPSATIAAIAGALVSPQVWIADDELGTYTDVEITDSHVSTYRFGEPSSISLTIRSSIKTLLP